MTTLNAFATLAEYKDYIRSRGGSVKTDTTDDAVIEFLLKTASRFLEAETGKRFIPYIETRYYDVPTEEEIDPRVLKLDGDLLEIITLTNGDNVVIPDTEYKLRPKNVTPHYGIRLNDNSTFMWASDGTGDVHDVIAVSGYWAYHDRYSIAWALGGTSSEAMDASETGLDVVSNSSFVVGDLARFDNELGYISALPTNSLTITRGENGSTATTHLTGISVYIWRIMEDAKNACIEFAQAAYMRRFGQGENANVTTATEALKAPPEIPAITREFINKYKAIV